MGAGSIIACPFASTTEADIIGPDSGCGDFITVEATIYHTGGGPTTYVDFPGAPAGSPVSTPEPGTLTLLGAALLGLGAFYLRRRRATA